MRYKKFIFWLIIFFGYIAFLHLLSTPVETSTAGTVKEGFSGGPFVVPGISNTVSVQIIRAPREYWFGIIKAPAYVLGMNIDSLNHLVIDYAMPLLLLVFIVWGVITHFKGGSRGSVLAGFEEFKGMRFVETIEEGENMNKGVFMNKKVLKGLARGLGIGILLAFFAFLLGDSPTIAVLLLVLYMEIRLGE